MVTKPLLGVYCFPALQLRSEIPCNYRVQNPLESNRICQQFKPREAALAPVFMGVRSQRGLVFLFHKCEVMVDVMPKTAVFVNGFN